MDKCERSAQHNRPNKKTTFAKKREKISFIFYKKYLAGAFLTAALRAQRWSVCRDAPSVRICSGAVGLFSINYTYCKKNKK